MSDEMNAGGLPGGEAVADPVMAKFHSVFQALSRVLLGVDGQTPPAVKPDPARIVTVLRTLLTLAPANCGMLIDLLDRSGPDAARYFDGLVFCLRDHPPLDERQWRIVERWLGDVLVQALRAGADSPGIDRPQVLDLASRLQTWRKPGADSPEGRRARLLAQRVAFDGLVRSMARHGANEGPFDEALDYCRVLFALGGADQAAEYLADAPAGLADGEWDALVGLARQTGRDDLARLWSGEPAAGGAPALTDEATGHAGLASDRLEKALAAGDLDAAHTALRAALAAPGRDEARLVSTLRDLVRRSPDRCGEIVEALSGAAAPWRYLDGLLYTLRDRPSLDDRQWGLIEDWIARACCAAMAGHPQSPPLDRAQVFDLIARLNVWQRGKQRGISAAFGAAAARQLALGALAAALSGPETGDGAEATALVRALVDMGQMPALEAFLADPPAIVPPELWLAIADFGSTVARGHARAVLIDALTQAPDQLERTLKLARFAPDQPDPAVDAVLHRFVERGGDVVAVAGEWVSGLLCRDQLESARHAVSVLAGPLGTERSRRDVGIADALSASAPLRQALSIDAYRALARYFVRHSRPGEARQVLAAWAERTPGDAGVVVEYAEALIANGEPEAALLQLQASEALVSPSADYLLAYAEAYSALGRRDEFRATLEKITALVDSGQEPSPGVAARLDWLQIQIDAGDLIAKVALGEPLKGVVAIVTLRSPLIIIWTTLVACELRKRGYETVFLDAPACAAHAITRPEIAALNGLMTPQGVSFRGEPPAAAPHGDWREDRAERKLGRAGYDIFQAIHERIATSQRRYVPIDDGLAAHVRENALLRADVAIRACERIADYVRASGQRVMILTSMVHYSPACIYRQFAASAAARGLVDLIDVNVGYESYRSNDNAASGYSVSVGNLTRNPEQRSSYRTNRRAFETWLAHQADGQADAIVDDILHADRARKASEPEAEALRQRILAHRAAGGRVICLLGKVTYDIAVEVEGGPGHVDMADWLNHSIEAVRGKPETLLLIKPHPYEIDPYIAQPEQKFTDLIEVGLPDNCVVLGHRWFNIADLLPLVDAVSLWHGTAVLEVLSQGVPVIVGATCGRHDLPIDVIMPTDRKDYERLLTVTVLPAVAGETRQRARKLIEYLVSDENIIPYPYADINALRNSGARRWGWKRDQIERYLRDGDRHMHFAADICETGQRQHEPTP